MELARAGKCSGLRLWSFVIVGFLILATVHVPEVSAYTREYNEDFTTVDYRDESVTNVTGWGAGEVTLPKKDLTLLSAISNVGYFDVEGDIAFVIASPGVGTYLEVWNMSSVAHPELLGQLIYPGNGIVQYEAGYVYVCASSEIRIINVTDLAHPEYLTAIPNTGNDVYVEGAIAYTCSLGNGLRIYNVTDPSSPVFISNWTDTGHEARYLRKSGNYVYVISGVYGQQSKFIDIVDVTDLRRPTHVCQLTSWGFTSGKSMDIEGNLLAVWGHNATNGITLFDVSSVEFPGIITYIPSVWVSRYLEIEGGTIFGGTGSSVYVIDVSNPYDPAILCSCGIGVTGLDIKVSGEYILISGGGFEIYRFCDSIEPVSTSHEALACLDLCTVGSIAYTAMEGEGLQILDISDPTDTQQVISGFYPLPDIKSVFVSGRTAFAVEYAGLCALNVTDPHSIALLDSYSSLTSAEGISVIGDFAYVTDANGLSILNVTDLHSISLLGSYSSPTAVHAVWSNGRLAYLAAGTSGLIVVNVTDPTGPQWLYTADTPDSAVEVEVSGTHAYVADSSSGLQVFSLLDSDMPILVGSYNSPGTALDLCVSGDQLYLADGTSGLVVLDITFPCAPRHMYTLSPGGMAYAVEVVLEYAYLCRSLGFDVVQVRRGGWEEFIRYAIAQSDIVYTSRGLEPIPHILVDVSSSVPEGTSIKYFVSSDNGTHWKQVSPNVDTAITYPGQHLRWRAELQSSVYNSAPKIFSIALTFSVLLEMPYSIGPEVDQVLDDNTPTFIWWWGEWGEKDEAYYDMYTFLLQIDNSSQFDSENLVNLTLSDTYMDWTDYHYEYTLETPLQDGVWCWRVAAIDEDGRLGQFSPAVPFTIDTGAGTTTTTTTTTGLPEDLVILMGIVAVGGVAIVIIVVAIQKRRK
ncbi:MAG: hypothetical protein EAX95_15830 [Candidatus Thorarchaeota archaeon]|nr:hypothetical protein [Candidatus Thorarchaeota archaeon]